MFQNITDIDMITRLSKRSADERIYYGRHPLQFGDLRIPSKIDHGLAPLVIVIHGGQWESSYSLDGMSWLAEKLTSKAIATWNIEFRRLNNPGGGFPGTFQDVADAVDFVRTIAKSHPIDLDRVVILGHSSGGHLGAWAAARANMSRDSPLRSDNPFKVRGIVDIAGVLDLEHAYRAGRSDVLNILGAGDEKALASKSIYASPINLLPMGLPQRLIIGDRDDVWRIESHKRYRQKATSLGEDVQLTIVKGANHFDMLNGSRFMWKTISGAIVEVLGDDDIAPGP